VHLHYALPRQIPEPLLLAYQALMTEEERAREARLMFEKGRLEQRVTRALVRTTLSRYAPSVPPEAWRFGQNEWGCPSIASPDALPRLRFNLSHTDGMVIIALTTDVPVGVDVEPLSRRVSGDAIAERHFAPSEVAALKDLPAEAQARRFLDYWTLKE